MIVGGHKPIKIALWGFLSTMYMYSEINIRAIANTKINNSVFLNLLIIILFDGFVHYYLNSLLAYLNSYRFVINYIPTGIFY